MGISHGGVCYVCLNMNGMLSTWYDDFSLAYPFAYLCVMCGLFLCNDHQPSWCEQMWEPLAVVMVIRMLQL